MLHPENSEKYKGLTVNSGVEQPSIVNPYLKRGRFKRRELSVGDMVEGILKGNLEADYLLFLEGKAIGVLEAKRESTSLSDIVANQAENYTHKLLSMYQYWENPLPLIYLSI